MSEDFLTRLLELIIEDEKLHTALIEAINAKRDADLSLARWRDRRK